MKRLLLLFIFLICSCGVDRKEKMRMSLKKYIMDRAFKENKKVSLLVLSNIRYTEMSEKDVQASILNEEVKEQGRLIEYITLTNSLIKTKQNQARLYREINLDALSKDNIEEADKELEKVKLMLDDAKKLSELSESRSHSLNKMDSVSKHFYSVTVDIRATVDNSNTLDSFSYILNKNFQVVNISDSVQHIDLEKYK